MDLSPPDAYPLPKRSFLPQDFKVSNWNSLEPYFQQLLEEDPQGLNGLVAWLNKLDELESVLLEDYAWRFIRMSCDTDSKDKQSNLTFYHQKIAPKKSPYGHQFNRKIFEHPAFEQLPEAYYPASRIIRQQIHLYRKENIPIQTRLKEIGQQYSTFTASMTVEHNGQDLTLQQALKLLDEKDRNLRQTIWDKVGNRRLESQEEMETIFDEMLDLRHQVAINAGFDSFTRYKFADSGRFDYSISDTQDFHQTVEEVVRPVLSVFLQERQERLGLEQLRPFDLQVDMFDSEPLSPFNTADQLLEGVIRILHRLKPELANMLKVMHKRGFLDLESRKGKMPGGYNYPLMESGIPFIFINAVGSPSDVITLLHESGHAVQSFLIRDLPMTQRNLPSEVAELAAMTMELIGLDFYDEFYPDPEDRRRAQKNQLRRCITMLSWIAAIDAFQQWVYDHPGHSREERTQVWKDLYFRFHGHDVDWDGYEQFLPGQWHKQPHVFEYPFYYIEYGLAQLGALSIWKNFRKAPQKTLNQYLEALSLGYTRTIPEIYQTAGIQFDFSRDYIQETVDFCLDMYQSI